MLKYADNLFTLAVRKSWLVGATLPITLDVAPPERKYPRLATTRSQSKLYLIVITYLFALLALLCNSEPENPFILSIRTGMTQMKVQRARAHR